MQQSIVKCYCFVVQTLLNMFRVLLCPSSGASQTAVAASGFRMNVEVEVFSAVVRPQLKTLPPPHSYGNQRLQRQFDGLLMKGIVMPETCWAVSVRQSNKILRLIVASSWVFYLSDWRCTEPQTLTPLLHNRLAISHLVIYGAKHDLWASEGGGIWNHIFWDTTSFSLVLDTFNLLKLYARDSFERVTQYTSLYGVTY